MPKAVLDHVAHYLEYAIETGETGVEMSRETLNKLKAPPAKTIQPHPAASGRPSRQAVGSPGDAGTGLKAVAEAVAACTKCQLHATRTRTVPGQGNPHPEILFVGEGPGAEEDMQGLAFVGAAGQLLTKMIEAMGYTREQVFIANVVKCRPPGNRQPLPEEMTACLPYLKEQIALLQPRLIILLGNVPLNALFQMTGITRQRGRWLSYEGFDVMPTYHPSYLLRMPSAKKDVWADLQEALKRLGRTAPPVKKKASSPGQPA